MNETLKPEFALNSTSMDRDVRQVTHRDYNSYLTAFNLPETLLAKIETAVDVGACFSDFSEKSRQKFHGLRAIALDPIYGLIKSNPDLPSEELEKRSGVFLDFDPSYRGGNEPDDPVKPKEAGMKIYDHFIDVVKEHPSEYIVASHQNIPLTDQEADLVLANNCIIRSENKPPVIKKALQECLRILKKMVK